MVKIKKTARMSAICTTPYLKRRKVGNRCSYCNELTEQQIHIFAHRYTYRGKKHCMFPSGFEIYTCDKCAKEKALMTVRRSKRNRT
jgi:hypothetical protein